MPEATDIQMQTYCDQRIRVRAESQRLLLSQYADDKLSIDDEYSRGAGTNAWADARTDGPPHLLQSGNSANPDDVLNYNSFVSAMLNVFNGTGEDDATKAGYVNAIRSAYPVFQRACVRPV